MRQSEITGTMISQSKEIWELLKPGEFVPEPGDWVANQSHAHGPEMVLMAKDGNLRTWSTSWLEESYFGINKPGVFPIFTFSHCLDLLRERGWAPVNIDFTGSSWMGPLITVFNLKSHLLNSGDGDNAHEAAQAVLLNVLKGES